MVFLLKFPKILTGKTILLTVNSDLIGYK